MDCIRVHGTYWSGNVAILLGLFDYEGFGQDVHAIVEDVVKVEEGGRKEEELGKSSKSNWNNE